MAKSKAPRKSRKASKKVLDVKSAAVKTPPYEQRVRALEEEGLTTSDAQAVVDAEDQKEQAPHTPTAEETTLPLTAQQIVNQPEVPAPTSLRQASIQRSVREKVNKVILTRIGGSECPKFYDWGWSQRDAFMAKDTPEARAVKARYEAHLRTIGL
jgi:hypothetical protein